MRKILLTGVAALALTNAANAQSYGGYHGLRAVIEMNRGTVDEIVKKERERQKAEQEEQVRRQWKTIDDPSFDQQNGYLCGSSGSEVCNAWRRSFDERKKRQQQAAREAAEEEAKRRVELQAKEAEKKRLLEIEMRKPINRLRLAYYDYKYVQACHRERQGYLVVWINDVEMERARNFVTRIEKEAVAEEPNINAQAEYADVHIEHDKRNAWEIYGGPVEQFCRWRYYELEKAAPRLPEVKDFGQ